MQVLVSGSTGLVGTALVPALTEAGHEVIRLLRSATGTATKEITYWDPEHSSVNLQSLDGVDAVVHLAGESIASGRWSTARKDRIRSSRVDGTHLLCESLAHLPKPPRVIVSASAIGYYGSRGDEVLTESSSPGEGYLSEVCQSWEAACEPARQAGIRVVNVRFGMILSTAGGALATMLTPFKMGVGGIVGSGRQFVSWVAIDDVVNAILYVLQSEQISGAVNVTAPHPVSNREFTKTFGKVLGRPTVFPMPEFAARLAFGEMADELLLSSQRVHPERLQQAGYTFRLAELEPALRHVLNR